MSQTIIQGDCLEELKRIKDNTIDAVITDPPYGIAFLGKDWDSFRGTKVTKSQTVRNLGSGMRMTTQSENLNYQQWCEQWARECLRVLKPGGWLLAFSAARLYHRIATGIEDAGFEVRDQIMWIYASGFPKAQDIGKAIQRRQGVEEYEGFVDTTRNAGFGQTDHARVRAGVEWSTRETQVGKAKCTSPEARKWEGWKTALKPAHEPIVMARKPMKGSTIDNVLAHGVGALNIDATRIPFENEDPDGMKRWTGSDGDTFKNFSPENRTNKDQYSEYSFGAPGTGAKQNNLPPKFHPDDKGRYPSNVLGDIPNYQKYFYCPKVSRAERHRGFEAPANKDWMVDQMGGHWVDDGKGNQMMIYLPHKGKIYVHGLKHEYEQWCKKNNKDPLTDREGLTRMGNNHPTVKPVALMKYLIRLVTPAAAHIMDPFTGSGSTGMACRELGRRFTGIEKDENYCEIARKRIAASRMDPKETLFE